MLKSVLVFSGFKGHGGGTLPPRQKGGQGPCSAGYCSQPNFRYVDVHEYGGLSCSHLPLYCRWCAEYHTAWGSAFPTEPYTAHNLAEAKGAIMEEWGIRHKVTCLLTDAASNMLACGRELHLKQAICIAHAINLMAKKSLDDTPGLEQLRTSARRIVTLFWSSTTAKVL